MAQWAPECHMGFDQQVDNLVLDSIYGTPTWQVGTPHKVLFDSAYSAPHALVTDTILPYPTTALSYAEFHIGVERFGDLWELTFHQRLDVDTGEAAGWLEFYDPVVAAWARFGGQAYWASAGTMWYGGEGGTQTDSGVVFTNASPNWTMEWMNFSCEAVLVPTNDRGGVPDTTMQFRFVFNSINNSSGRDGWMIDDVHLHYIGPCTGISENSTIATFVYPIPADDLVNVIWPDILGRAQRVEVTDAAGRVLIAQNVRGTHSGQVSVPIAHLTAGAYGLRCMGERSIASTRFIKR